ncbi:MAG: PASTA domain-containing protein [Ilumatobacteraceae bacterium]
MSTPGPNLREPSGSLLGALVANRFRIVASLTSGSNSAIFDAVDESSGRLVTVKIVRPELASSPSFRTAFDDVMRRVAALSHPNIAAIFDWGLTPVGGTSTAYVVSEALTGGSLRDVFDRGRRLSPSQALAVGLDVCRALDHAHRRAFVHTELTPSKIVFGDDRRLRIVDFGLSRLLGESKWRQPDTVENHVAWYSAPELAMSGNDAVDGRADVYSLCLLLHEAVTGTLPFKSDSTVASLAARVGRLMPVSADLGPLAAVLERAGRPDADGRSTAADFGKGLIGVAAKLPRPEPLPLLSSGLFETPSDRLRLPDDPTGGVVRPSIVDGSDGDDLDESPAPAPHDGNGLVILTLDADLRPLPADGVIVPVPDPEPGPTSGVTVTMPVAVVERAEPPASRSVRAWFPVAAGLVVVALVVAVVLAFRMLAAPVYAVPDLTGKPRAEALNLIAANDWTVEEVREASDVVTLVDHVVRTTPSVGSELAEGEPFLIVVSTGPVPRELPESTGLALVDAETRLRDRDLQVSVVDAFDETVPAGTVVSWSVPLDETLRAGSTVPPETLVVLVVSVGPEPRAVPDLIGFAVGDARTTVQNRQLVWAEPVEQFDDVAPAGIVIGQDPPAGTELERGAAVTVVVSKGVDLVAFPDLSDASDFEVAARLLIEAGFDPRLVFGDTQGAIREITIDGETPDVGDRHRRGTVVEVSAL